MIDRITIVGGLVRDPELRYTKAGQAVCEITVAQSDSRRTQNGQWETTQSLYLPVQVWNDNPQYRQNPVPWAELVARLHKGDRVAVHGKLVTRTWEAKDGSNRSRVEMQAIEVYVRPASPAPQQASGQGGSPWGQQATPPQQGPTNTGATWGNPAPAGGQAQERPPF